MKRCLIIVNAYSRLKSALNQSARLKEEFARLGVTADVRPNDFFPCAVEEGGTLSCSAENYDFCVYLDKDKYVARMLEKCGMRLFNSAAAIEDCDDKMLTSIKLADCGIPMPLTLPGLLCYTPGERVKESALDEVERRLGYPVIVKASYGSLGSGVFKAENRAQLEQIAQKLQCSPHLFERYVANSAGRDVRIITVGGKVVAAMLRQSDCDFRSNIELGGTGSPFVADGQLTALCQRVARHICPDYCGIDVLFGEEGYLVCEVNSNAFFGGIERVTGVNVAKIYAQYMYDEVYGEGHR